MISNTTFKQIFFVLFKGKICMVSISSIIVYFTNFNGVWLHLSNFYQQLNHYVSNINLWVLKDKFEANNLKFEVKTYLCVRGTSALLTHRFFPCVHQ